MSIMEQIGYTDNVRLRTSTGETAAATGYTTIGYLEKIAGTYVVTGIDWSKGNGSNDCICYYKGQGDSYITGDYVSAMTSTWQGIDFTLSDNKQTLTLALEWSNVGYYIRFSGYGSGANVTITQTA